MRVIVIHRADRRVALTTHMEVENNGNEYY